MKPLNLDNSPCAPQSSNCVIWQGPNIPCIKLCTGDTISDITYKVATELCEIMSELNLTNYDLACLNLVTSQPTTFNELIQLLINKICELQNIPSSSTSGTGGCPDCVVTVAPCFQTGGQTTMQLLDYVTAIANRVCGLVSQITTINASITSLTSRVTTLENTPPPSFTLPSFNPTCPIGSALPSPAPATPIDQMLIQLVNNTTNGYCSLLTALGNPAAILSAYGVQCVNAADDSLGYPGSTMTTAYTAWIDNPTSLSDSFVDLWLSLCDVRLAISNLTNSVVAASSDTASGVAVSSATVGATTTYTVSSKTYEVVAGSGITVTPVTVGLKTTYTIDANSFGGLSYNNTPSVNTKVSRPVANTVTLLGNGVVQPLNTLDYNDGIGSWNSLLGKFTVTNSGRYNISFIVRMSFSSGFTDGMMIAGIANVAYSKIFVSNTVTINQTTKFIELSGSAIGVSLSVGNELQLLVLNATDQDYAVVGGDIVSMTIQRIK